MSKKDVFRLIAFVVLVAGLIAATRFLGIGHKLAELRSWIKGLGFWGPFVFAGIFSLTTVAAIPGSVMSILAGAMFGTLTGVICVSAGSTAGAGLAFLVARYLARAPVERWVSSSERLRKLDEMTGRYGPAIVAITRLIPLFPFTFLNYAFGLTKIGFPAYLFWSWLCMLPGTVLYVSGSDAVFRAAAQGRIPWLVIAVFAAFAVLLVFLVRGIRRSMKQKEKDREGKS